MQIRNFNFTGKIDRNSLRFKDKSEADGEGSEIISKEKLHVLDAPPPEKCVAPPDDATCEKMYQEIKAFCKENSRNGYL